MATSLHRTARMIGLRLWQLQRGRLLFFACGGSAIWLLELIALYLLTRIVSGLGAGLGHAQRTDDGGSLIVLLAAYLAAALASTLIAARIATEEIQAVQAFVRCERGSLFSAVVGSRWDYLARIERGGLVPALTTVMRTIEGGTRGVLQGSLSLIFVSAYVAASLWLSPLLTLIAVIVMSAALVLTKASSTLADSSRAAHAASVELQRFILEHVDGLQHIRSASLEQRTRARLQACEARAEQHVFDIRRTTARQRAGRTALGSVILAAAIVYAVLVLRMDPARLAVVGFIYLRLWPRATALAGYWSDLRESLVAYDFVEHLRNDLRAHAELDDPLARIVPPQERILVSAVSLRYGEAARNEPYALHELSLEVPVARMSAVVGPSGSGKSSLAAILAGQMGPSSGEVWIDGQRLWESSRRAWRAHTAWVPAESWMEGDTLRQVLAEGRASCTDVEMWHALANAHADSFVRELPGQLDVHLGERARRLSAGQRQRIAIARALLARPSVLILDEATNALDADSERCVIESLGRICRTGMTIVIVTHSPVVMGIADHVVVLENGRLKSTVMKFGETSGVQATAVPVFLAAAN